MRTINNNQIRATLYTANIGSYDKFPRIKNLSPDIQVIVVTDLPSTRKHAIRIRGNRQNVINIDVREILPDFDKYSSKDASRFVKMHPHLVIQKQCDYAIWFDSRFDIKKMNLKDIELFIGNFDLAVMSHPQRINARQELDAICNLGLYSEEQRLRFINGEFLSDDDLEKLPLVAAGFFCLRTDSEEVKAFLNIWWDLYMSYGERDQIYFGLAASRSHLQWREITIKFGGRNPYLFARSHVHKSNSQKSQKMSLARLVKAARNRVRNFLYWHFFHS